MRLRVGIAGHSSRFTGPSITAAQPQPPSANANTWQGVVNLKPGETLSGVSVMVGQDAAGLSGRAVAEGTIVKQGTRVHLVPGDPEQANNILRYSESVVNRDASLKLTNLAPGRYFVLVRVEAPAETETTPRPVRLGSSGPYEASPRG